MAKGYPTPKPPQSDAVPDLVPANVCVICKKRPRAAGEDTCATCAAALA